MQIALHRSRRFIKVECLEWKMLVPDGGRAKQAAKSPKAIYFWNSQNVINRQIGR